MRKPRSKKPTDRKPIIRPKPKPMYHFNKVSFAFCIELSRDKFNKINNWDRWQQKEDDDPDHEALFIGGINEAGALNINYNGHFGSFIYFDIDNDINYERIRRSIHAFLKKFFKDCKD